MLANSEILDLIYQISLLLTEDSGSDEDFMAEDDDDDSDYGRPKRRISKVSRRSKDKKSPKPKIRASGKATHKPTIRKVYCNTFIINHFLLKLIKNFLRMLLTITVKVIK